MSTQRCLLLVLCTSQGVSRRAVFLTVPGVRSLCAYQGMMVQFRTTSGCCHLTGACSGGTQAWTSEFQGQEAKDVMLQAACSAAAWRPPCLC